MEPDYGLRKRVQNQPIQRELDVARQRELVRTVIGGACVLVAVMFAAWQHLDARRLGKVEFDLTKRQSRLLEERRHLALEKDFLEGPARVEAIATHQLGMKPPTRETSAVIERVTVTSSPTSAVVAQR